VIHICPEEIALLVAIKASLVAAYHWIKCGGCRKCYRTVVQKFRRIA